MFKHTDMTAHDALELLLEDAKTNDDGISAHVIELDADFAEELLRRNESNRAISKARVRNYRHDAEQGKWALNGQPIIVSSDGILADGQHRAAAIAGTTLRAKILLVVGIDPAARTTLDQARPRTAGDYLQMSGEQYGSVEAGLVRYVLAYKASGGDGLKGLSTPTNADILAYFREHSRAIRASVKLAVELRDSARYHVAAPMLAFTHYILAQIDPVAAEKYIRQVGRGEDLAKDDPAYTVREKLLSLGRVGATKKAEVILAGWKPFIEGRQLKQIRTTGKLPAIK